MIKLSLQVRGSLSIKLVSKSKGGLKREHRRWLVESSGEENVKAFLKEIFHFQVMWYHFLTQPPSAKVIKFNPG